VGLEELRAFLHVVDEGSFASAASTLAMSRTTLRRHVDALEAETGVLLLERNSKGVVLTEAGRKLARGGRVMEQEFSALLRAIREDDERLEGEIRMTLPTGLMPTAMALIFGLVQNNWPGVRVRSTFMDEPHRVKAADADLVVWFGETPPVGSWETRVFGVARQRLLASPDYLKERGTPQVIADLAQHRVLAWLGAGEDEPFLFTRDGDPIALTASAVARHPHLLHECAHLGFGIAWVPDGALAPSPGREPLVAVLDDRVGRDVRLHMGVPRSLAEVPKVRVFLQNVEEMRAFVYAQIPAPRPVAV
jgi:DNA-binding transcriptional LysR family regulator